MAEERRLDTLAVTVDGRSLDAEIHDRITEVRVEESVRLPDRFELRIDDPHFEAFDQALLTMGSTVEIAFRAEGEMLVVTTGEVTTVSVEPGASGRHELVATGFDPGHRLHRGPKSRTFQQVTDADIATRIAEEHGLEPAVDASSEVHPYVVQTSQSDYSFLAERAHRIGYDFWVTQRTLHFAGTADAAGTWIALDWGDRLLGFRARFSSTDRCDEVVVRGWDPVASREIVGRADEPDLGTTAPAAEELRDDAGSAFGQVTRSAGHFPVTTQSEADALAASLLARASSGEALAWGEAVGDPRIAAGVTAGIGGVGDRLSGDYLVTAAQHLYRADTPYVTRFWCGSKEPSGLLDLMGGGGSSAGRDHGWGSLVLATVTNVDDPEGLHRVKVKFADLPDTESTWAFVAAPGAGADRGVVWIPDVGDTVLVGFEHDDKARPVVLGGLWSRSDPPPEGAVQGGKVVRRLLRSADGHRLELVDESPGEAVLALGDDRCRLVLEPSDTKLEGDQKITIGAVELQLTADSKLVLEAPQIEINGSGRVAVSGGLIELN